MMRLLYQARATAVACLLASSPLTNAQAFYYEDISQSCSSEYAFQELGCYASTSPPFIFASPDWAPDQDHSLAYIQYNRGDHVNTTVTPAFCSNFCRAQGYKYAGLWDQQCFCGSTLSYTKTDKSLVALRTTSASACANSADPCPGDRRESCGTKKAARIFVDPSFNDGLDVASASELVSGYGLLGCFRNPNLPPGDSFIASPSTGFTNSKACLSYCADLRLPYVHMSSDSTGGPASIQCFCGAAFGSNAQAVDVATSDTSCFKSCTDINNGCEAQDCCGVGDGPFPVYANPDLMGCYIPRIPGSSEPSAAVPASADYRCFTTPSSIASRPTAAWSSFGPPITRTATFVAAARPAKKPYFLYGCFSRTTLAQVLPAAQLVDSISVGDLSVDSCLTYCDTHDFDWAALVGLPDVTCHCSHGKIAEDKFEIDDMQDCNQPCPGSDTQNCGGVGPLVYGVVSKAKSGPWATSWIASYATTPTYSCRDGESTTSPTTSATSSTSTVGTTTSVTATPSSATSSSTPTSTVSLTTTAGSTRTSTSTSTSTTSHSVSTTTSPTASTSPSDILGITHLPESPIILSIVPIDDSPDHKDSKTEKTKQHSPAGAFIGPGNPTLCNRATPFVLTTGQLSSSSDGQLISSNRDISYKPLAASSRTGSITETFSVVNDRLRWYSDTFYQGRARYCRIPKTRLVYVTFHIDKTWPADCEEVDIAVYPASRCRDGEIVPGENAGTAGATGAHTDAHGGGWSLFGGARDEL